MYNKLFTKILDSTIWLAPDTHRIVWITLIAAMDENSLARFASVANLAARARVPLDECQKAVDAFMAPDPVAEYQEFEGRRLERNPDGWVLLNGDKYRAIVNRAVEREQWRERSARYRDRHRSVTESHGEVTLVTDASRKITLSDTSTDTSTAAKEKRGIGGDQSALLHHVTSPPVTPDTPTPKTPPIPPFDPSSIQGLNLEAFQTWIDYKQGSKHKLKAVSLPHAAKLLASYGGLQAEAVETAIANGWQGLHAPDAKRAGVKGNGSVSTAWDRVLAFVRAGDYRSSPTCGDEAADRAVKLVGGYARIGQADGFLARQLESRFREVFEP